MRNVIYYGGSFSPPTMAHLAIAKLVQSSIPDSIVLFSPVSDKYSKSSVREVTAEHRINMLTLSGVNVSTHEAGQAEYFPTYITLKNLQKQYPGSKIYFIIGEDNANDLPKWYNYESLISEFTPLVVSRSADDISSTKAREAIRTGDISALRQQCHPAVINYILEHQLYH